MTIENQLIQAIDPQYRVNFMLAHGAGKWRFSVPGTEHKGIVGLGTSIEEAIVNYDEKRNVMSRAAFRKKQR
jgi:hypothetical protein